MSDDIQAAIRWCTARAEAALSAAQLLEQYVAQCLPAVETLPVAPALLGPAPVTPPSRTKRARQKAKASQRLPQGQRPPGRPAAQRPTTRPTRRRWETTTIVLQAVTDQPRHFSEIRERTGLLKGTLCYHLKKLVQLKRVLRRGDEYSLVRPATQAGATSEQPGTPARPVSAPPWGTKTTARVLAAVRNHHGTCDEIATACSLRLQNAHRQLVTLVRAGLLRCEGSVYWPTTPARPSAGSPPALETVWAGRKGDKPLSSVQREGI